MGISTISVATCDLCRTEIDRRDNGAPVNTTNSGRLSFSLNPLAGDPGAQIELLTCRPCARKVIDALRQLGAHVAEIDFQAKTPHRRGLGGEIYRGELATPGYEPAYAQQTIAGFGPLGPAYDGPEVLAYDDVVGPPLTSRTATSPRQR